MMDSYITGRNPVLEVLRSDRKVFSLFIQKGNLKGPINEIIELGKKKNINIRYVTKEKLDSISSTNAHQGVAIEVEDYNYASLDEILSLVEKRESGGFLVILDEIEDPHNLGSIIRTCECAGVDGLIIPKHRSASVNQTVYKSSAGAAEHMKVAKVTNIAQTIDYLKEEGFWIYGADAGGESYYRQDLTGKVCLVIGNEGKGMTRLVKEKCDLILSIPMKGKVSSLNASNAASILVYEVVRQNHEKK